MRKKVKNEKKILIGICGRSGSGKGYVCDVFESFGGLHIDTDALYHELLLPVDGALSECSEAIRCEFGDEVIKDLTVDRRKLAKIVFSDEEKLSALNSISHRFVKEKTFETVNRGTFKFALIDAPLLFESGFDSFCDFTVCVFADDESCISRIMKRDGISREDAAARLSNQKSITELTSRCDFSVDSSDGSDVVSAVKKILNEKGLLK